MTKTLWENRAPTPEELAQQAEAHYQERLLLWQDEVSAAIASSEARRAFDWGEMTLTAYRDAVQNIAAGITKPVR